MGSIPLAQRFILESLKVLKPGMSSVPFIFSLTGGVGIHFVQITLSSLTSSWEIGENTIWRKKDVEKVTQDARRLGYMVITQTI